MKSRDEIQQANEFRENITDLYYNHRGMAYSIIKKVLGSQVSLEEQDDLVQEGFCRMLKCAESMIGRTKKECFNYMCSTMLHLALDEGRKRSNQKLISFTELLESEELAELNVYGVSPEDQYISDEEWREVTDLIHQSLAGLSQQDYELILGHFFYDLSDKTVGKRLGMKEAFVRVYRNRALKKVAKQYRAAVDRERQCRIKAVRERPKQ